MFRNIYCSDRNYKIYRLFVVKNFLKLARKTIPKVNLLNALTE